MMDVDIEEVKELAAKLKKLVNEVESGFLNRCSFRGLSSGLVSVQSMFDQVNALAEGEHSLKNLVDWHVEEGRCVAAALESQTEAICRTESATCESINDIYDSRAAKIHHESYLPADQSGLGHGIKLSHGHRVRTFPNSGTPLVPESMGQDVDYLAVQFAKFDSGVFADCAQAWKDASEQLTSLASDLRKIASDVKGSGSDGTYTSAASAGMRRWIESLDELGEQAETVSKRLDSYAKDYEFARQEINAIADEQYKAKKKATPEHPYNPVKYRALADDVLQNQYNPSLTHADTHKVEIPIPLRALYADDTVHIPAPQSVFNGAGVGGGVEGYTASPFQNHPQQTTPHPRHNTPPTNRVGGVPTPHPNPGQGSGHNPHPGDQPGHPGHPGQPGERSGLVPPVGSYPQITQPHPGGVPGPHPGASAMPKSSPVSPARTGSAASPIAAQGPAAVSSDGVPYYPGNWSRTGQNNNRNSNNNASGRSDGRSLGGTALIGAGVGAGINRGTTGIGTGSGSGFAGTSTGFGTSTGAPVKGSTPKTTITPNTPAGAGSTGGRPGMGGMPGAPGMGSAGQQSGKSQKRRHRRSAANTERILPQPGNLPRGPIRHPDDPLYGTGR